MDPIETRNLRHEIVNLIKTCTDSSDCKIKEIASLYITTGGSTGSIVSAVTRSCPNDEQARTRIITLLQEITD